MRPSYQQKSYASALWVVLSIYTSLSVAKGQTVIHVPADHPTIQLGINAAANGDTVLVAPGTYKENINFVGKAITVTSSGGPQVTIIDGGEAPDVVTVSSGETSSSVLSGFTLQNGSVGILIGHSSPSITGNVINQNVACNGGVGIQINSGSPLISRNVITGAQAGCSGGGVSITGGPSAQIIGGVIAYSNGAGGINMNGAGTPTIRSNIIVGNTAFAGGGISMINQSDANIIQNLIIGNSAPNGGGGGVSYLVPSGALGPTLINNTIADNDGGSQGSGVLANDFNLPSHLTNNIIVARTGQTAVFCANLNSTTPPLFDSNDVFPQATAYGGICTNQTGTNGNISADPLFVAPLKQ